jgi:uroporphyrinogen III methyltransferase/synthase
VRNFVSLVGPAEVARMVQNGRPAVACIGPVTADTAREHGLPVDVAPAEYTVAALARALMAHFAAGA